MAIANVDYVDNEFHIKCPFADNERAKAIPERKWGRKQDAWIAPATIVNAAYLKSEYSKDEISPVAEAKIMELKHTKREIKAGAFPPWYKFKNEPFDALQKEVLDFAWPLETAALFMDMGTGKTWTTINLITARVQNGQCTGLVVIPETGQKPVWMEEFPKHCPIEYELHVHESGKANVRKTEQFIATDTDKLQILVVGVESLSNNSRTSYKLAQNFLNKHNGKAAMAIDESSSISNPKTRRTKLVWDLGALADYRYILNGTPINQGIEDLWAQFRFLDWRIIGMKSFTSFKARYCSMGGFEGRHVVGYRHVEELMALVKPFTFIVKITDMIDMPPQVYESRYCTPSSEQARLLKELGDVYMSTNVGDLHLDAETVLERMTRYQQIVGGFFPYDVEGAKGNEARHEVIPIEGKNPKLDMLVHDLKLLGNGKKVIIYARFRREQELIAQTLGTKAIHYASLDGKPQFTAEDRSIIKRMFRDDDNIQYLVCGKSGYKGLDLPFATYTYYYSNSFSYIDREQSERRSWRKGQEHTCVYVDITMEHKIDKQIIKALKNKQSVAEFVNDQLKGD